MKTIKMQHELNEMLEKKSGVPNLTVIRLKGYDPSWTVGGIRKPAIDEAAEVKLQIVLKDLQAQFDIA